MIRPMLTPIRLLVSVAALGLVLPACGEERRPSGIPAIDATVIAKVEATVAAKAATAAAPTATPAPPPALDPVWSRRFFSISGDQGDGDAVLDGAGNVYVVSAVGSALRGQTYSGGRFDVFLRKYDDGGEHLWTRQFGTEGLDRVGGVVVDSAGNAYVAGSVGGALPDQDHMGGDFDIYLRKYDREGEELWTRQIGSEGDDFAHAVALDEPGNVYLAGHTRGPGTSGLGDEYARLYKLDSDGRDVWTRQFGTAAEDQAISVAVDGSGNVYVSGPTTGAFPGYAEPDGHWDSYLRKYDAAGDEQWTVQVGTEDGGTFFEVVVDAGGFPYVIGTSGGGLDGHAYAGGTTDAFVRKYDPQGNDLWTRQFGSRGFDVVHGVTVDQHGSVYLAGFAGHSLPGQTYLGGRSDAFVRKYDGEGNDRWTVQFGTSDLDSAYDITVGPTGAVYLLGVTRSVFPIPDGQRATVFFVTKYSETPPGNTAVN